MNFVPPHDGIGKRPGVITPGRFFLKLLQVYFLSNSSENYTFAQHAPAAGTDYYRLREVDLDGKAIYSEVRSIQRAAQLSKIRLFPNPVTDKITLINEGVSSQSVTLLTLDGKSLQTHQTFTSGSIIDMSSYPSGIYLLSIRNAGGNVEIVKIKKD